ncbi:phage gp29-like protein [Pseudomonas alcaligenes]|nr:phage gp29-like protein [Pseudomonas alcaligenes]
MVTPSRIVGLDGRPLQLSEIREPQTAHLTSLHHEVAGHPSRGLTPSKLAAILDAAEYGDIVAQCELYEDMEEKDGHIYAEMSKRRRAVAQLDWNIVPPDNATAKEKAAADTLFQLMQGLDDFEEVLFDTTDAIGKGFSCQEFDGWQRNDGAWLPKAITHRPQSWFQLPRGQRQEIRLRGAMDGIPLQQLTWITHVHKAKSGYLERGGLFRVLVWPYLFKNYSVGDLAEFLEIYGIPMRVGRYPTGATEKEKLTLLRALAALGHNAAGIIPNGMELEFLNAAQGDPKAFQLMMDWCERTQSKAILGGTLTSQADGKSSTNALGNVHNEVRKDLRDGDAKMVAKTISRDLVFPIAVMNGLAVSWARCPRLVFDTQEPEDLAAYATALPPLVKLGFRIPRSWAQQRLAIPEPAEGEEVLADVAEPITQPAATEPDRAVATAQVKQPTTAADQLDDVLRPATDQWITRIRDLVQNAASLDEIRDGLEQLLPDMSLEQYADAMAQALAAAALQGRTEILQEVARGA